MGYLYLFNSDTIKLLSDSDEGIFTLKGLSSTLNN